LLLLLLCGLIISCKDPYKLSSYDDPPKKATVTISNPMPFAKKLGATGNSASDFISLQATVIVLAADLGKTELVEYSKKTVVITPNQFGTAQIISVKDVNVPEKGPLIVQVSLKASSCTDFLVAGCNINKGGKPEYFDKIDVSSTGSAAKVYNNFNLKLKDNNCC